MILVAKPFLVRSERLPEASLQGSHSKTDAWPRQTFSPWAFASGPVLPIRVPGRNLQFQPDEFRADSSHQEQVIWPEHSWRDWTSPVTRLWCQRMLTYGFVSKFDLSKHNWWSDSASLIKWDNGLEHRLPSVFPVSWQFTGRKGTSRRAGFRGCQGHG